MRYSEQNSVKVALKPSPSLLYNNLCYGGGKLAYAHLKQVYLFAPEVAFGSSSSSAVDTVKVETQDADIVHTVQLCSHEQKTYLVIASEGGVQVFTVGDADRVKHVTTLTGHTSPVVTLTSVYQCRRGKWAEDLTCHIISADETGNIIVWEAASGSTCIQQLKIPGDGVPAVSLAVRGDLLIAARLDGSLKMMNVKDGTPQAQLVAHSRWISAMDIHPEQDIIATVAEDCTLGIWTLPTKDPKVSCLLSSCCYHMLLTGVAFCGKSAHDVAAIAYDADEVAIFKGT